MTAAGPQPEFSRPVKVDELPPMGATRKIEASAEERAALARRFGILGVDRLEAEVTLRPMGKDITRVDGHLIAEVRQACVVTLAEVPARIDEKFARLYAPPAEEEEADEDGIEFEPDGEDPPDPLIDGTIDIGEAAAEELALALDPYPRAPGAVFSPPEESEVAPTPFAALEALKKKE